MIALGIHNVLCAPLTEVQWGASGEATGEDRRLGVLYLDSRERQSFRSNAIRSALETLANEAASAIDKARLYRESLEKAGSNRTFEPRRPSSRRCCRRRRRTSDSSMRRRRWCPAA